MVNIRGCLKEILQKPFFPFLLVLLALVDLFLSYYYESSHKGFFVTLVVSLLVLVLAWRICFLLIKDHYKTSLVIFFFAIIFFEFQSIILLLRTTSAKLGLHELKRFWNTNYGQIAVLGFLFLVLIFLCIHYKNAPKVTVRTIKMFNFLSLLVMVASIWQAVNFSVRLRDIPYEFTNFWDQQLATIHSPSSPQETQKPNIYYIVLDAFGRSDVLSDLYGIDNSEFIQDLESRGFFIANKSYSNYNQTTLSLASSLNMMYMDEIAETLGENTYFSPASTHMIENSIVEKMLRNLGYQTIGFYSETTFTIFSDREYYFRPQQIPGGFFEVFLKNTALSVFLNSKFYDWHRDTIKFTLETLPKSGSITGPKFVFAHVLSPHPPFVFDADGSPLAPNRMYTIHDANRFLIDGTLNEYRTGYGKQLTYLQKSIIEMVDQLQENETEPYILILQGDHGPGSETNQDLDGVSNPTERHGILYAVYFFDEDYQKLYSEISPVNTFRVIFSQYLGEDFSLLPDLHFTSTYGDSLNYHTVDDQLK